MDTEFFTQRIQCSRSDKLECLDIIWQLMELATFAHKFGLLDLDKRISENPDQYSDPFLRKAISTVVDVGNTRLCEKVLYNYIFAGNYTGQLFLKNVVITETVLAMAREEGLDYMFSFLVPSLFGVEFETHIVTLYEEFKKAHGEEE